jgi:hypothetical protein
VNAQMNSAFEPPLEVARVIDLIGSRRADRDAWRCLRRARRQAWIVLHDHEDRAARDFVNAVSCVTTKSVLSERLRHCRVAALARAIRCNNRAVRIMEIAHYKHLRRMAAPKSESRQ